ncbi:hypothetical protein BASA81_000767 [Batrachochytrium salamandrivorans]|nr:hypothetical protein BASA81_000741 [Batrachochytrium salamandrivorans]KAH9261063.1 hypothetical protein BASA81_000767 [Batrachochytrium salamandrivorans]
MHSKKPKLALFREAEGEAFLEGEALPEGEDLAIPLPAQGDPDRPDRPDPHAPAYRVPVERFGLALLRGMGYRGEEGCAPCLPQGRPGLLGLGAGLALQPGARQFVCNGSVCQVRGTHRFAVVRQTDGVPGPDMVRVALLGAGGALEELALPRAQLVLQDLARLPASHAARRAAAQLEEAARAEPPKQVEAAARAEPKQAAWLRPGLRVLVARPGSPWFKHKGWVARASGHGLGVVRLDGGGEHEFKQRHLQTTVQVGRPALLLARPGLVVGLVEDKDKRRALLRLPAGEPQWLPLDDVCEIRDD